MLCAGRYKTRVYGNGNRREQMVDLEEDPGEMKNLAADPDFADILARHRQYLREWVETNHDKFAAAYLIKGDKNAAFLPHRQGFDSYFSGTQP